MGRVVVLGGIKGGTGKTTLAVNLACCLAGEDIATCLLDTDPQATATSWAAGGRLPIQVRARPLAVADPAGRWVAEALWLKDRYDLLVIDLPAVLTAALAAALAQADLLLLPVTPSLADIRAAEPALRLLRMIRETRAGNMPRCLVVPSRVDRATSSGAGIREALARLREPVAPEIGDSEAHLLALAAGVWIGDEAPGTAPHDEIRALAQAVRQRLGLTGRPPGGDLCPYSSVRTAHSSGKNTMSSARLR